MLLAVFVPMLLLSSLHVHETGVFSDDSCSECVDHQCHGHLSQLTVSMHQCVLCQLLSLTYLAVGFSSVAVILPIIRKRYSLLPDGVLIVGSGVIVTRGPPASGLAF